MTNALSRASSANDHVSSSQPTGGAARCSVRTGRARPRWQFCSWASTAPDEGKLFIGGRAVRFHSPKDAQDAGIFMVHQHLRLVESMTVAENVCSDGPSRRKRAFPRTVEKAVAGGGRSLPDARRSKARIWQLSLGERSGSRS